MATTTTEMGTIRVSNTSTASTSIHTAPMFVQMKRDRVRSVTGTGTGTGTALTLSELERRSRETGCDVVTELQRENKMLRTAVELGREQFARVAEHLRSLQAKLREIETRQERQANAEQRWALRWPERRPAGAVLMLDSDDSDTPVFEFQYGPGGKVVDEYTEHYHARVPAPMLLGTLHSFDHLYKALGSVRLVQAFFAQCAPDSIDGAAAPCIAMRYAPNGKARITVPPALFGAVDRAHRSEQIKRKLGRLNREHARRNVTVRVSGDWPEDGELW